MRTADAAGNIELFLDDVIPQAAAGRVEALIARQARSVRHAGIEVDRAHSVAHGLILLAHGRMRLMIGGVGREAAQAPALAGGAALLLLHEIVGFLPALVDEEAAQGQIALLTGDFIEADQRHLRDLMARIALALALLRAKTRLEVVRKPAGRAQELVLAGALIIGDRRLGQMAEAVQLVMITQVGQRGVHAVDDIVCVEIAVLHLR